MYAVLAFHDTCRDEKKLGRDAALRDALGEAGVSVFLDVVRALVGAETLPKTFNQSLVTSDTRPQPVRHADVYRTRKIWGRKFEHRPDALDPIWPLAKPFNQGVRNRGLMAKFAFIRGL